MKIENLSDKAVLQLTSKLLKAMQKESKNDAWVSSNILSVLVNGLDEADSDDTFGTEGWRHFFGMEEDF